MVESSCKAELISFVENEKPEGMEVLVIMAGGQLVPFNRRCLKREVAERMPRGLGYHVALCQRDQENQITGIIDPSFRRPKTVSGEQLYLEQLFGKRAGLEEIYIQMMVMPLTNFETMVTENRFDPYEMQRRYGSRTVMI
jgi:hypothetical protein